MSEPRSVNRRDFLKHSAGAAFAFTIVPRHVLGGQGQTPPSEKFGGALIGCGGRGPGTFGQMKGWGLEVDLLAACDVHKGRMNNIASRHPGCKGYTDFRRVLERKDIDIVAIGTPPHWHALISIMAMEAGMDVLCEKPATKYIAEGRAIARGNGRAYGDSALSATNTLDMRRLNRMLEFDPGTGQLVAEAGVLLGDVIAAFLPRGWFPHVTPGTRFVTLGGAIAADVHGKNHHKDGSFGAYVDWIDLIGPDGMARRCSATENADLFGWTVGGMGLTGVIARAAIRLRPVTTGWIAQQTVPTTTLEDTLDVFEGTLDATYSVGWVDCLATGAQAGRSLVMLGEHAAPGDLPPKLRAAPFDTPRRKRRSVPLDLPGFVLTPAAMRAFNAAYYRAGQRRAGHTLVDWDSYFYPLDSIGRWNRIYGRNGFMQFQCVLPLDRSLAGLTRLLDAIAASGQGSFLSVLKRFGPQESRFSFPMEGYTLALDFPRTRRSQALMPDLDRITLDHGGRFYLAKDSRMSAETLAAADPRAEAFKAMRAAAALPPAFASAQSERLKL